MVIYITGGFVMVLFGIFFETKVKTWLVDLHSLELMTLSKPRLLQTLIQVLNKAFCYRLRSFSGRRDSRRSCSSSPPRTSCGECCYQRLFMRFWEHAGARVLSKNVNQPKSRSPLLHQQQHPRGIVRVSADHSQNPSEQAGLHAARRDVLRQNEILHTSDPASQKGLVVPIENHLQTIYHSICHSGNEKWNTKWICFRIHPSGFPLPWLGSVQIGLYVHILGKYW